ncbi:hypothetical protein N3K66_002493 [Trichothecium roseum]|uniref:Uncharacterized protein n=1 Tax=Trichothecium roseum TaxID=47278 RepID=A0ACC0VB63_9HYPO|nr:hypothetical protein N3K66_002493 [Trichothecium roseum]
MTAPTILIAGATGNTGQSVVETLSRLSGAEGVLTGYRILALTRSLQGATAQRLARLPRVEVQEKSWVEVTSAWLRQQNVERAFVAPHGQPSAFVEESAFYAAALEAGVRHVVRISTNAPNVRPDTPVYYARAHWAVETLLASPEFEAMGWTSLQANCFSPLYLSSAAEFVRGFRAGRREDALKLIASKDAPVGIVHPADVGAVAAHLLAQRDLTKHSKAKYILNGPEDITGEQIVQLVEQAIGANVKHVHYNDLSFVDYMLAETRESHNVILSLKHAFDVVWGGQCTTSTTSEEILQLGLLRRTPIEVFRSLLEDR